ncbi:substrate-binding periplasmic protein [Halobacteriovorax marinus]|uniref:substrate-binding periplasmic protein n=1 Tax=Halobacteriovorax marinus TaxID=97084 RepID=UPI003A93192C
MRAQIAFIFLILLSSNLMAKTIRIGGLKHIPPYFNKIDDTGIELDILKAAFSKIGYDYTLTVFSNDKRATQLLRDDHIDAIVSNTPDTVFSNEKTLYTSDNIIDFVDCAITLSSADFQITNFKDLASKSVWAFTGASKALGKEFYKMSQNNPLYNESGDQLTQPRALMKKRIDVAISDINIFLLRAKQDNYKFSDFKVFTIAPLTPRSLRFKSKQLRDDFNKGLKVIQKNGTYQEILNKYKNLYRPSCN